jgi:hypothetical protein
MRPRVLWLPAVIVGIGVGSAVVAQRGEPSPGRTVPLIQNVRGGHAIRGEVVALDERTGIVALKTDRGDLQLYFPPSSLEGVQEGDRLEVRLAFVWIGGRTRGNPAGISPRPRRRTHGEDSEYG